MKRIRTAALLMAIVAAPAQADTVADWNKIAMDAAVQSGQPLEYKLRAMAMVHVAMFETLNFIQGLYDPHFIASSPTALDGMSLEAAAAAAAYHVLVDLFPYQRPAFAATLKNSVHAFPGSQVTATGVATGTRIGAAICTSRASDGPGPEPWLLKSASPFRSKGLHPDASPLSWNTMIAKLIATRELSPIESARIHALVSMAIADAYTAAQDAEYPCAACVAAAAVATILESELEARLTLTSARTDKTDEDMGRTIGEYALRRYRRRSL